VHAKRLIERSAAAVQAPVDSKVHDFAVEVRTAARLLGDSLAALNAPVPASLEQVHLKALEDESPRVEGGVWLSRKTLYDQACCQMVAKPKYGETTVVLLRRAIYDLEIAAVDDNLRIWARHDPSFALLQSGPPANDPPTGPEFDRLRRQFKRIVGDPPPSDFLDLALFRRHATALRSRGIDDPDDLLACDPRLLSSRLNVEPACVERWRQLAELSSWIDNTRSNKVQDEASTVSLVALLLDSRVRSCDQLRNRLLESPEALYNDLVKAAVGLAVAPTRGETVDRWRPVVDGCHP